MSRHSKNNTAHSIFTYHERKSLKDTGTLKARLGSDHFRRVEDCWLCLRAAISPLCTPDGYIYCRKCLFADFERQYEGTQRKRKEWELTQLRLSEANEVRKRKKILTETQLFINANQSRDTVKILRHDGYSTRPQESRQPTSATDSSASKAAARAASFWIAENTPSIATTNILESSEKLNDSNGADPAAPAPGDSEARREENDTAKPKRVFCCPVTKKRLRLKELVEIRPIVEEVASASSNPGGSKTLRWLCSVSGREIGAKEALVVKTTGQIVLSSCIEQGVFSLGQGDAGDVKCSKMRLNEGESPVRKQLDMNRFIKLIPSGTGFSAHNKTESTLVRPVME